MLRTTDKMVMFRALAAKLMEEEAHAEEDIELHHAPSECWGIINKATKKRIQAALDAIGLTYDEWATEMEKICDSEPIIDNETETPMSHYEFVWVEGHIANGQ